MNCLPGIRNRFGFCDRLISLFAFQWRGPFVKENRPQGAATCPLYTPLSGSQVKGKAGFEAQNKAFLGPFIPSFSTRFPQLYPHLSACLLERRLHLGVELFRGTIVIKHLVRHTHNRLKILLGWVRVLPLALLVSHELFKGDMVCLAPS